MQDTTPNHTNNDRIFTLLQDLLEIPGPSGQEEAVRVWLRNHWRNRMKEWIEDPVGNIVCRVGGSGPKLLIVSHMDEIGFVVRYITPQGFLVLDPAQGDRNSSPERRYAIGQIAQVVGRTGVVAEGVFTAASGHTLSAAHERTPLHFNEMLVDLGAKNYREVEQLGVYIGAGVIWYRPTQRIGQRIIGKAMDDRMLLAIMTLMLDDIDINALSYELWFAATVQEENGVHGAKALAHTIHVDQAIALDVGIVGDIPTVGAREYPIMLSGGPTLVHKDSYVHYDERMIWQLADVALANQIPFQHGVYSSYGSDAIAFIDHGTPAVLIGVPTRYTHTAFEMVEESDITNTVNLLKAFATRTQ